MPALYQMRRLSGMSSSLAVAGSSNFPLSVNGRGVDYANGDPFQFMGETEWAMLGELDQADMTIYLDDRAAKGVKLVEVRAPEPRYSSQSPVWRNANGDLPFSGTLGGGELDFTTPVEAYWAHVDWFMGQLEDRGMVALFFPSYLGFPSLGPTDGWASRGVVQANGSTRMATYGTFIGQRYANQGNIIFCIGGDADPDVDWGVLDEMNAMANAIKAAAPNHLMSAYAFVGANAADHYDESWLDINSVACHPTVIADRIEDAYAQHAGPVFLLETHFGNENGTTDASVRASMWTSILNGIFGTMHGYPPMWPCNRPNPFEDISGLDWHDELDSFGAQYYEHIAGLLAVRDLSTMVPNWQTARVTTANFGAMHNSQQLVAYVDINVTINETLFTPGTYRVRWYNPQTGALTTVSNATLDGSGTTSFSLPNASDWVLLMDDVSLGLGLP